MASHDVLLALDMVSQNGYTSAIENVTRDLERARMEREDLRHVNGPFNSLMFDNEPDWCSTRGIFIFSKDEQHRLGRMPKRVRDWYVQEPRVPKYRKAYVHGVVTSALG